MSPAHGSAHGRFVRRENRFVVWAARDDGEQVRAYLPNTGGLDDLLLPDAPVVLERADRPSRTTAWTLTRVWDGTWVALDATAPPGLLARHLETGASLGAWPATEAVRREVVYGRHRFDLELDLADGRTAVVEVKSLTSAVDAVAPLSSTPSARGAAQLEALSRLAATGTPAAVALVVQRADVEAVDLAAPAAASWVTSMRAARAAGVLIAAFACEVGVREQRLGPPLAVRDRA